MPTGLRLAPRVPLGQVADEPAHVVKADTLRLDEWIGHRILRADPSQPMRPYEHVVADRALLEVIVSPLGALSTTPRRIDPASVERSRHVGCGTIILIDLS